MCQLLGNEFHSPLNQSASSVQEGRAHRVLLSANKHVSGSRYH